MRPFAEYEEVDRWIRWGVRHAHHCANHRRPAVHRQGLAAEGEPSDESAEEARSQAGLSNSRRRRGRLSLPRCHGSALDENAYSYLLGMYLGDGHIARLPRTAVLRVTCSLVYPRIIDECELAIHSVRPGGRVWRAMSIGCLNVGAYWKHWPCVFPQHGPGRKHERKIWLSNWQSLIVAEHADRFLRGLIHSDGYRGLNRVKGKGYPRYQFTNESEDIRGMFCRACDVFGVRWRPMNRNTISIARSADVAALDRVVGPKA